MGITRKNPDGTYRIPMNEAESLRIEWQMEVPVLFGKIANLLGEYEKLGTPDEIKKKLKQ